jgi:hypothetical protein
MVEVFTGWGMGRLSSILEIHWGDLVWEYFMADGLSQVHVGPMAVYRKFSIVRMGRGG